VKRLTAILLLSVSCYAGDFQAAALSLPLQSHKPVVATDMQKLFDWLLRYGHESATPLCDPYHKRLLIIGKPPRMTYVYFCQSGSIDSLFHARRDEIPLPQSSVHVVLDHNDLTREREGLDIVQSVAYTLKEGGFYVFRAGRLAESLESALRFNHFHRLPFRLADYQIYQKKLAYGRTNGTSRNGQGQPQRLEKRRKQSV